ARTTKSWAKSLDVPTDDVTPSIKGYRNRCPRTARDVSVRSLILHGVVAVAQGVSPAPIIRWFRQQEIWDDISPNEKTFLTKGTPAKVRNRLSWHLEAEWTLLWTITKVQALGLPDHECDSRQIVDAIVPPLGGDIGEFVATAKLRPPGLLLAEDD